MSQQPGSSGSDSINLLLWLTSGGGALLLLREGRQWWREKRSGAEAKRKAAQAAPEVQAAVESRAVNTAKDVLELVDELVAKRMAPIQDEVDELRERVVVLEDELRSHSIPIPPSRRQESP